MVTDRASVSGMADRAMRSNMLGSFSSASVVAPSERNARLVGVAPTAAIVSVCAIDLCGTVIVAVPFKELPPPTPGVPWGPCGPVGPVGPAGPCGPGTTLSAPAGPVGPAGP